MIIVTSNGHKIDFKYELIKLEDNTYQLQITPIDEEIPSDSTLNI